MAAETNGKALGPREAAQIRAVANAFVDQIMRSRRGGGRGAELDRRRDVAAECGWPKNPTAQDFADLCRSNAYAAKANAILPDWTWAVHPDVYEDEDEAVLTPFEASMKLIDEQLGRGSKLVQPCAGALAWPWLCKADRLAGIGRYSCLLIGTDDGLPLDREPQPRKGARLTYLRAFSELDAKILEVDTDVRSPRHGEPTAYQMTFRAVGNDASSRQAEYDSSGAGETHEVHWRRVVHFTRDVSPVYSDHFLEPLLPHLLSMRLVHGADPEGCWQWGFPLLAFETPPELGGEVDVDLASLRDEMEKIFGGLKRWISAQGAQVRTLSPELYDPSPHVLIHLHAVCAYLECPMRTFLGSEEGKLAGGQDSRRWHGVGRDRRLNHATPRQLAPFVDRLIWLGVLAEPERYTAFWPDTEVQTHEEKARTAQLNTQALAAYANSDAPRFVGPMQYLTAWQGFTGAEAHAMIAGGQEWAKANPPAEPLKDAERRQGGQAAGAAGEYPS